MIVKLYFLNQQWANCFYFLISLCTWSEWFEPNFTLAPVMSVRSVGETCIQCIREHVQHFKNQCLKSHKDNQLISVGIVTGMNYDCDLIFLQLSITVQSHNTDIVILHWNALCAIKCESNVDCWTGCALPSMIIICSIIHLYNCNNCWLNA